MNIGKITDNYKFYEGFEDEPEIEISTLDKECVTLHIWDGFFNDIFNNPPLDGKGWKGFTRDYNQFEGAFSEQGQDIITDLQEYLDDLNSYKDKIFEFEETKEVFSLLASWLDYATQKGYEEIMIKVI